MKNAIKNLVKKTPPMEWLLGRLNKIEKTQKEEISKRKYCVALLKDEILKRDKKIDILQRQLKRQESALRIEMNYLYYKGLDPSEYADALKEWYKGRTGKTLNLDNPQTYDEKIQWMKLYDSTPIKTRLADKYLVREWVAEKIGEEYLIPLLGVYDKFDDIDFDKLPDKFVMKAAHGSGWNIIVRDKAKLNMADAKKKFDTWMNHNYAFNLGLELHYLNMTPRIIIEEYLENSNNSLDDYKVFCFDGKAYFIGYMTDRKIGLKIAMYDRDWELLPFYPASASYWDKPVARPKNLGKLLSLAETLSKGFAHVRVDFYCLTDGSIKFGEMTFTPASGAELWSPVEYDKVLGDYINLPEKSETPRLK